jgi:hypothetical protein
VSEQRHSARVARANLDVDPAKDLVHVHVLGAAVSCRTGRPRKAFYFRPFSKDLTNHEEWAFERCLTRRWGRVFKQNLTRVEKTSATRARVGQLDDVLCRAHAKARGTGREHDRWTRRQHGSRAEDDVCAKPVTVSQRQCVTPAPAAARAAELTAELCHLTNLLGTMLTPPSPLAW